MVNIRINKNTSEKKELKKLRDISKRLDKQIESCKDKELVELLESIRKEFVTPEKELFIARNSERSWEEINSFSVDDVEPMNGMILVAVMETKEETKNGIILPSNLQMTQDHFSCAGRFIKCSKDVYEKTGIEFKFGQIVYFELFSNIPVKVFCFEDLDKNRRINYHLVHYNNIFLCGEE